MPKAIDLTGQRFTRLIAMYRADSDKFGNTRWLCHCDCGNDVIVYTSKLRIGEIKSCGCFALDRGDITGQRFGRLVALERLSTKASRSKWRCICDCGRETTTRLDALRGRDVQSCGCYKRDVDGKHAITHGHTLNRTTSREYRCWQNMHQRCRTPTRKDYKAYGGRGITVCERWSDFASFLADMGECPPGHSIERIDVNGHYAPQNCIWIPLDQQHLNKRQ
jgi:hypothetical protein